MKIIGHHTCRQVGSIQDIENEGPFLSTHIEEEHSQHKFLGTGYYFWDNNINMAHSHGQKNCKRKYYIFEANLDLKDKEFLDLAGNRIDMLFFQDIMKKLNVQTETQNWTIAHFIELLKKLKIFNYRAIRAIDNSIDPKEATKFVVDRANFTNLNPIFIVCLLDKEADLIQSFNHIKTFPQNV